MRSLIASFELGSAISGIRRERAALKRVRDLLQELEETLAAGLVPATERWAHLASLPAPWGALASQSLQELRSCGGALLPTLGRLRALAVEHDRALGDARAKSSQALAQAFFCAALVPAFGGALYCLLPALEGRAAAWLAACAAALALAGLGAAWMLALAEQARWGGLPRASRPWVLASQCAGERFLALVRSGNPPDLAWARACSLLEQEAPGLAARWSPSVWTGPGQETCGPARPLVEAGAALRKAVQVSLMEGRPCAERVETALLSLRQELKASVERELQLLGTRALKPLFACVAPALLMLLAFGLWLSWEQMAGGVIGF